MKKVLVWLVILLSIAGCASEKKEDPNEEKPSEVLQAQRDGDYAMLSPFVINPIRQEYSQGFREVDLMELGHRLYEDSKSHFPYDKYQIKEGSIIDHESYLQLLKRNNPEDNPIGLNLARGTQITDQGVTIQDPILISDIYEMNFVKDQKSSNVAGISVALVLKRMQVIDQEHGTMHALSDQLLFEAGSEIGRRLEATLRGFDGGEDVPIFISLYAQQSDIDNLEGKYLPGHTIGRAFYDKPRSGQFEKSTESWMLLNTKLAQETFPNVTAQFNQFRNTLLKFISDESIGVVGKIFVKESRVHEMVIEISSGNKSYLELFGSAQKVMSELERFNDLNTDITVNMKLYQNTRIVIHKKANKAPTLVELR